MKKAFLSILSVSLLACSLTLPSHAQSTRGITGDWVGLLGSGESGLPILFHITGDPLSGYQASFDNPLRRIVGSKCKTIAYKGDSLFIEAATGPAVNYRGKYQPAMDSIYGIWYQDAQAIPLHLKRMLRPQTPHPPCSYRADSVEYDNADKTVHLGATLTRPLADRKYPVAILITGSGLQDRDETILGHKSFAVIADYLTRQGIAVLRVDDRTMGLSTGDMKKATSSDYADDVIAGINYLKTRDDIDTTQIGLIGHSEGGFIGPIAYSRWPHLKFIIMLAGPGVPGSEIVLRQQTDPVKPMSQAAYEAYYPLIKQKLQILNDTYGAPDSVTINRIKTVYAQWKSGQPDSILVILHAKDVSPELFGLSITPEMRPWVRYFYKTDPAFFLIQIKCPVLALDGEKDIQVYPKQNIPVIKATLLKGGNKRVTTYIFPGMNHLFQHCNTCQFSEYATLDETFAPEVLKTMGDWIRKICNL
jgi:uncharacterized protein